MITDSFIVVLRVDRIRNAEADERSILAMNWRRLVRSAGHYFTGAEILSATHVLATEEEE